MKHVSCILALLFVFLCAAQDYSFEHFETIKSLNKANDGNIYLVTDYSICKFRGTENEEDCFYSEDKIDKALVLSKDNFFIGQDNLLKAYKNFQIIDEVEIYESITELAEFHNQLIIGTSGAGAYVYNNGDLKQILKDVFVNDLTIFDNHLYVLTDKSILVFDESLQPIASKAFKHILKEIVVLKNTIALLTNSAEVIFLNTSLDVDRRYSAKGSAIERLFQINNNLYAVDKSAVLKWHNNDFNIIKETLNPVKHSAVSKNVLLTAYNNRVDLYNLFTRAHAISNAFSIFPDGDKFWLGREGEILYFNNGSIEREINLPSTYQQTFVSSIVIANDKIYAGTMGNGILCLNKTTGEFLGTLDFDNTSESNQNVIQMDVINNALWIGYLNGLKIIDLETNKIRSDYTTLLKNNYLYQFYAITDNEFYLCTSDAGLIYHKEGITTSYLDGNTIYSIAPTRSGMILSVEDEGLYRLNDTLEKLEDKFYLNATNIYNMMATENTLFVGHNSGVDVVGLHKNEVDYLTYNQSLGEPQLNSIAMSDTKLLMAFENAIVEFDKTLLIHDNNTNIRLLDPLIFNVPVKDSSNTFKHDENTWTFNYSSVNLNSHSNTYYKYRLKPLEQNWVSTNKESTTYYNLPSNDYTFEVSSGGHINFVPTTFKRYAFTIKKPFWEHYLFWVFSGVLFVVLIYTYLKYRENKIKKREALRTLQLEFEYQKLKDQVNPHFLFNSFNSIIGVIEDNPKQGVNALEKLSSLYRHILEYEKAEIIQLSDELAFTQQYFKIHKLRFQNLIELNVSEDLVTEGKLIIPFSLQLNVENAIKHNIINSKHKLRIDIFEEGDYIVVSNTLNEKKNRTNSTGLGLKNLINRHEMRLDKKPIIVKTAKNFIVKIPFIHD